MAQRVITYIEFTDDLTGESFAEGEGETLTYAIDGAQYEIDLTAKNAEAFREVVAPYLQASRKTVDTRGRSLVAGGGTGTHPEKKKGRRTKAYMEQVARWAVDQGYKDIPMKRGEGRFPEDVLRAYEAANPALAWKD